MKKEWKRIENYEVAWWLNRIRRAALGGRRGGVTYVRRPLKTYVSYDRYIGVGVVIYGKRYDRLAPIIALAYLGSRPRGMEVHHKDGNRRNNDPRNLEYISKKLHHRGSMNGRSKLTEKIVKEIKKLYATGKWPQAALARKYKVSIYVIWAIVVGKIWRHVK